MLCCCMCMKKIEVWCGCMRRRDTRRFARRFGRRTTFCGDELNFLWLSEFDVFVFVFCLCLDV